MANFIESATLKIVDDASKQIKKINKALKDLQKTADGLKKTKIGASPGTGAALRTLDKQAQGQRKVTAAAVESAKTQRAETKATTRAVEQAAKAQEKAQLKANKAMADAAEKKAKAEEKAANKALKAERDRQAGVQERALKNIKKEQDAEQRAANKALNAERDRLAGVQERALRNIKKEKDAEARETVKAERARTAETNRMAREAERAARPAPAPRAPGGGARVGGERGVVAPAARSFASGLGIGGVIGSYGGIAALNSAAYLAAAALRSLADASVARARTDLQSATVATDAQRNVFEQMSQKTGGFHTGAPIPFGKDQFRQLWASLLGDVGGKTETQVAQNATTMAQYLQKEIYPRLAAANPNKTFAQHQEGLRKIVQAVNLTTTEIQDEAGNITGEAMRSFRGIQRAMAADPDLTPQLIKTTLAHAKTMGYTLDDDSITRLLISAGSRGVRAANEQFQAQLGAMGITDVKRLNNALADLGLLTDVKRNKKGNVIAGSGTPVSQQGLLENPTKWFHDNLTEKMDLDKGYQKRVYEAQEQEKTRAMLAGQDPDMGKVERNEKIAWIHKTFSGMKQTARQGIVDMFLAWEQMNRQIAQAKKATDQDVGEAAKNNFAVAVQNVETAWKDRMGDVGSGLIKSLGIVGKLKWLEGVLRGENPKGAAVLGVGGAAVAGGAAYLAFKALSAPVVALTAAGGAIKTASAGLGTASASMSRAGVALNTAAASLQRAAAMLMRAGAMPGGRGGPVPPIKGRGPTSVVGPVGRGAAGPATASVGSRIAQILGRTAILGAGTIGWLLAMTDEAGGETNLPIEQKMEKAGKAFEEVSRKLKGRESDLERLKRLQATPGLTPEQRAAVTAEMQKLIVEIGALKEAFKIAKDEVDKLGKAERDAMEIAKAEQKIEADKKAAKDDRAQHLKILRDMRTVEKAKQDEQNEAKKKEKGDLDTERDLQRDLEERAKALREKMEKEEREKGDLQRQLEERAKQMREKAEQESPFVKGTEGVPQVTGTQEAAAAADKMSQSMLQFAPLPDKFASVFTAGGDAIGGGGKKAVDWLTNAAPGIGATIGKEVGAAIQSAVSGLTVNVNANVTQKPNTAPNSVGG